MSAIWSRIKTFWFRVEAKVKAAGLWALAASILVAIVNALLNGSVVPNSPHAWVQFVITVGTPPVAAFVAGWKAKHESKPPVTVAKS